MVFKSPDECPSTLRVRKMYVRTRGGGGSSKMREGSRNEICIQDVAIYIKRSHVHLLLTRRGGSPGCEGQL